MSDLYSINIYLRETDSRIGSAQLQLHKKEEELEKLREALEELGKNKSDFIDKKDICLDPEFTTSTLHGKNADDLEDVREGQLQASFVAIPEDQIAEAEDKISDKIEEVQESISSIESNIDDLEDRRDELNAEKQEVKNKS